MLLNAIVRGKIVANGETKMGDWQRNDNIRWYLPELIKHFDNYN